MALPRDEVFYTDDFMWDVMGIETLPSKLYQYTSIESLEKILSNQSLRFSRLDKVNDPEEAQAIDLDFAASSVFVSCWSASHDESIPMWSMYGDNFSGVRIGMPTNMLAGRHQPVIFEEGGALTHVDADFHIVRRPPAMNTMMRAVIGPNKIYYTDDPQFKRRQLVFHEGEYARFVPYDLGMAKGVHWEYEQEWRFKISALSFESSYPDSSYFNDVIINFKDYPVEAESLFIPLDPTSFDEMSVTIGAKSNAEMVESIIRQFAPSAKLTPSSIAIR